MTNKTNGNKIIHIELKEPYEGKRHWYFGSKSAVYDVFDKDIIGCTLPTLRTVNLTNSKYENKKCIIRQGTLHRKQGGRYLPNSNKGE